MSNNNGKNWKEIAIVFGIPVLAGACFSLLYKHRKSQSKGSSSNSKLPYGCIELGGTSIRLAIGHKKVNADGVRTCELDEQSVVTIRTTDPETNLAQIKEYFSEKGQLEKVGIASFGPICLDKTSEKYGYITTTPKFNWKDFPIVKRVSEAIQAKVNPEIGFDTDVNAAALAEFEYGNHGSQNSLAYITVGTGVGVGLIVDRKCVHGLTHPEGGHIPIMQYPGETYDGCCQRHGNCVEGMVSNHAIAERLGINPLELSSISEDDEVWVRVAFYLAQLCLNLTLIASPEVIVLGGGILNQSKILPMVRQQFISLLAGYVDHPSLSSNIDSYIVKPRFKDSGLLGSMVL